LLFWPTTKRQTLWQQTAFGYFDHNPMFMFDLKTNLAMLKHEIVGLT